MGTEKNKINCTFLFKPFYDINKQKKVCYFTKLRDTKKLKFFCSTIFSKILRFFCLISSETTTKFYLNRSYEYWTMGKRLIQRFRLILLLPCLSFLHKIRDLCLYNFLQFCARRVG